MTKGVTLRDVFERMFDEYGPQHWWPADTQFEVIVGAILTQSASWANVEKAIHSLKAADALSPGALRELPEADVARLVYSSGYYNAKARKLKAFAEYVGTRFGDDLAEMARMHLESLRAELTSVHGVGEETADDILLYALGKPVFVIDAYTRRVFWRLGLAPESGPYSAYQSVFAEHLPADPELFGEYHALIVRHSRDVCRKQPLCEGCCLLEVCPTGRANVSDSKN